MRRAAMIGLFVIGNVIWQTTSALAEDRLSVPVRILDYSGIPSEVLARSQRLVSERYEAIGVHIDWAATLRPAEPIHHSGERVSPDERFIQILDRTRSRRLSPPIGAVGMAAVSKSDGGRVAYVFSGRVRTVARHTRSNEVFVMALVMAHELGHLLLPAGSHTRAGLMRGVWTFEALSGIIHHLPEFTRTHAQAIHQMLAPRVLRTALDDFSSTKGAVGPQASQGRSGRALYEGIPSRIRLR